MNNFRINNIPTTELSDVSEVCDQRAIRFSGLKNWKELTDLFQQLLVKPFVKSVSIFCNWNIFFKYLYKAEFNKFPADIVCGEAMLSVPAAPS